MGSAPAITSCSSIGRTLAGLLSAWWLGLSRQERDTAAVFTSGKESRVEIKIIIQGELKAEGTLKGEGITIHVDEAVDRTREEMRYTKSYEPGLTLEVWRHQQNVG